MTAQIERPPLAGGRSSISLVSRIYGLGSIYAKTLRDSRLAFLVLGGTLAALMLSGGAAFGQAYATPASRAELANLVANLPAVMKGLYGTPHPLNIEHLGGSIGWKTGPSMALIASLWSVFALASTLAGEARRGSLDFVAVTALGKRRIAIEKLAAHVTVVALVVSVVAVTTWLAGAAFGTLPGDEIPPVAAIGFALWVGLCALAGGALAFALGPFLGRAGAIGLAGTVVVVGYFVNGYQGAVPAFAGIANLTWFGWTVNHLPLAGQLDWPSLVPVAVVAVVGLAVGVEAFARRDLGATTAARWPGLPAATLGIGGPASRSLGDRLPLALGWGMAIGLFGFIMAAAALSFGGALQTLSPETLGLFRTLFPNIDLTGAGGFLQLTFVQFGTILAGFAAATLVGDWATDESSGRLEMLLTSRMARARWARSSGFGVLAAIVVMTAVITLGVAVGSVVAGGDVATPILGTIALGLYAAALAGIGLAVGGVWRSSVAAEVVAAVVIGTFLVDLLAPVLKLPDWVHQLALTAHLGQPMVGIWDWTGIIACFVLAIGGVAIAGWGMARRDVTA